MLYLPFTRQPAFRFRAPRAVDGRSRITGAFAAPAAGAVTVFNLRRVARVRGKAPFMRAHRGRLMTTSVDGRRLRD
jgi:hypothetical protein